MYQCFATTIMVWTDHIALLTFSVRSLFLICYFYFVYRIWTSSSLSLFSCGLLMDADTRSLAFCRPYFLHCHPLPLDRRLHQSSLRLRWWRAPGIACFILCVRVTLCFIPCRTMCAALSHLSHQYFLFFGSVPSVCP